MGHQAVGMPLKSFLYMFLIHQAFQPPVFCLILQSSVLQSSILQCPSLNPPVPEHSVLEDSPRDPPRQKPTQATQHWAFSAAPIAFCASECQKHMGKCFVAIFYTILPLMLAILPVLLAILAPTCPTSALKMPEKCHLGANIAKKVLQPPLQAPPDTQKPVFSLCFCKFSAIQPMCQSSPKMLPTCSQKLPS